MSGPTQEPTFLILTALAAEPMHGYGLIQQVAEFSEGRVRLRTGTLYGALDRLTVEGLVTTDREEVVDGRLRRYYRLTDSGANFLTAEAERLQRNAEAALARLRQRAASLAAASAAHAPGRTRPGVVPPPAVSFG